jgi:cation transport ATPase
MMSSTRAGGPISKAATAQLLFMALYIALVYVPFALLVAISGYNVAHTSISEIAWQLGGKPMIIWYGVLTLPFLLFQIWFYLKYNRLQRDMLLLPLILGCVLLGIGIIFPFTGTGLVSQLHCYFAQAGGIIVILAITGVLIRHLRRHPPSRGILALIIVAYVILVLAVGAIFLFVGSPALLEADSSLVFMIILYLINRAAIASMPAQRPEPSLASDQPAQSKAAA